MNYFKVKDLQIESAFSIYPFANVESIFVDIQESEGYICALFRNKDKIVITKEQYERYIDWLENA